MSAPHTWLVLLLLSSILEALAIATASTIYPPLTQAVYAVTTAISESLIWMKATFLLADLILIGVLIRLLTATGMGTARALIYASSPLVIVEVSGNTPNDVLAPACLMATHSGILHDRSTLSMCFLTLSGLAKLIGFALVALFARSVRAGAWLAVPVTALLVAWPYLGAGWEGFRGLLAFGLDWRANDSLFHFSSSWAFPPCFGRASEHMDGLW